MAVSVRMDPLLERELEAAAQQQGVTKSQFIIQAVERALGKKNPFELMQRLIAEEDRAGHQAQQAYEGQEQPYDTVKSRAALVKKLKAKHGVGRAR